MTALEKRAREFVSPVALTFIDFVVNDYAYYKGNVPFDLLTDLTIENIMDSAVCGECLIDLFPTAETLEYNL